MAPAFAALPSLTVSHSLFLAGVCLAGYGGAACSLCIAGSYSLKGTALSPRANCTACPTGTTTKASPATSAAACSREFSRRGPRVWRALAWVDRTALKQSLGGGSRFAVLIRCQLSACLMSSCSL